MTTSILVVGAIILAVVIWFAIRNKRTDGKPVGVSLIGNKLIDATECGHKTKIKNSVTAFGQTTVTQVPVNKDGTTTYCHECLEKMAIRCTWCGHPIFIGDPITLYSPRDKSKKMPDYAVLHSKEHNSYVGCLRWECAETGADRCGFWYPPGEVHRVPSPLEMCIHDVEQGGDGVIIVSDLSKP